MKAMTYFQCPHCGNAIFHSRQQDFGAAESAPDLLPLVHFTVSALASVPSHCSVWRYSMSNVYFGHASNNASFLSPSPGSPASSRDPVVTLFFFNEAIIYLFKVFQKYINLRNKINLKLVIHETNRPPKAEVYFPLCVKMCTCSVGLLLPLKAKLQ